MAALSLMAALSRMPAPISLRAALSRMAAQSASGRPGKGKKPQPNMNNNQHGQPQGGPQGQPQAAGRQG